MDWRHGNTIGGIIVDSGNFLGIMGNFPEFTNPSPGYHGMNFLEFGPDGVLGLMLHLQLEGTS